MIVESVELKDYRNYEFLDMKFNAHVNIIYGDNAQGKTNILESIYMCSTSKSHRGSKDREIVRFGEDNRECIQQVLFRLKGCRPCIRRTGGITNE
mgnify:CR=1 FL=1